MRSGQKRGIAETGINVAFVYYSFSSFVKNDYEILSKHFDVIKVNYGRILDVYKIMMAVLKSDISFIWFAGGHAFIAVLFSKIFRKKSIVIAGGGDVACVPEIDYGGMRRNKRSRYFAKFVLKHADIVLAVSEFTKREVLEYAKPKNLMVVYNGVDIEMFKPLHEKENNLVITVGNVDWWNLKRKGIEMFVRSAKFIPEAHFVVIGKNTDDSIDHLNSIASPNTEFTGFVSDKELLKWYQKSKVYCQLSYYESFGMAPAEAMACGCVPVVTDRGALPEVVGDTGFCVPYGNTEATVEAMKKALNSNKGEDVRVRVKNMFPIEKREKELMKIIEEVL